MAHSFIGTKYKKIKKIRNDFARKILKMAGYEHGVVARLMLQQTALTILKH